MGVDLLKHNQEAYEKIKEAIADGKKKIAISHATGTGKSYLIAKLFEDYSNDMKLVLVPSTYISDQIQTLFEKYSIQNVDVMLYQKIIRMSDEDIAAMNYDVVALDEYHHDTAKVWGEKVKTLIECHPESIIFGTSATPVRSDGVNTIDELFEGNCASDLPLSESIAKKIVPLPKYVGALYTLDDELEKLRKKVESATNTKEEKQEFYKKINTMRSQIEKSYGMPIILNKNIKDREGRYIVFCKNKHHMNKIKETVLEWFKVAGCKDINAYIVHSSYENKDAEYKAFCDDTSHALKLMFCVDMLNEGLHLGNISGVLLLRPTKSSIVWHQQIGRAIEANNVKTPVIIDAVNNFSAIGQGMGLLEAIKDAVTREKESDPNFDDSGFEDIDTFFVLENVIEIKEMFAEIEGRLQGSWENGLRHFDKYVREHDGDVLVPKSYVDDDNFPLGNWVSNRRREFKNMQLSKDKICELENRDFIWDVYKYEFMNNINALQQYRDREGDCLVPARHIEIVDGKQIKLGNWCGTIRNSKKGIGHTIITPVIEEQLDQMGFVWDVIKYKFESNVKAISKYYKEHGKFPLITEKNKRENKLGLFFSNEKSAIRNGNYPEWRMEIIKKYLPELCFETKSDESFNKFIEYLKLYKQEYGHLNIKKEDSINGYNIGAKLNTLNRLFRENKLCEESVKKIEDLGISLSSKYEWEKQFQENMVSIKQAVKEGVIINRNNQTYKHKNLYTWLKGTFKKRYKSYKVSMDELKDIEKLIGKSLEEFFNNGNHFVRVIDVIENEEIGIYKSCVQVIKYIQESFNIDITRSIVDNRLTGKVTTPYKGRFMFYYATNEEVKKYLEENKVS